MLFAVPTTGISTWRRAIQLEGKPQLTACATLDADLFHLAAPALRDLRLYNNGKEIPYAIDQSFDPRSLQLGTTDASDRSLYDPAITATATQQGEALLFHLTLPSHVPITRLRLIDAAVRQDAPIDIAATVDGSTEQVHGTIARGESILPVTLGANLQHNADVTITLKNSGLPTGTALALEMRRHWICFPAAATNNLWLYFGDPNQHAPDYTWASSFSMPADPQKALLLPAQPVPLISMSQQRSTLLLAATITLGLTTLLCVLAGIWLLSLQKKRKPQQ